jgi:hypothetical protein
LERAWVTSSELVETNAEFIFDDPETGFWCAQFGVLEEETYSFRAQGSSGNSDTVEDLSISDTYCS